VGLSTERLAQVPFPVHETLPNREQTSCCRLAVTALMAQDRRLLHQLNLVVHQRRLRCQKIYQEVQVWAGLELPSCWDVAGANSPCRYRFKYDVERLTISWAADGRLDPVAADVRVQLSLWVGGRLSLQLTQYAVDGCPRKAQKCKKLAAVGMKFAILQALNTTRSVLLVRRRSRGRGHVRFGFVCNWETFAR